MRTDPPGRDFDPARHPEKLPFLITSTSIQLENELLLNQLS